MPSSISSISELIESLKSVENNDNFAINNNSADNIVVFIENNEDLEFEPLVLDENITVTGETVYSNDSSFESEDEAFTTLITRLNYMQFICNSDWDNFYIFEINLNRNIIRFIDLLNDWKDKELDYQYEQVINDNES